MRLVVATRNDHKLRELARLLGDVELEPLPEGVVMPPETGETYAANALIKARAAVAATGRPAIADDSGIEAEPLGWGPGVRTARYAGPEATDAENLDRFVAEVPPGGRLRYVCVIAHVAPDGAEQLFEAACEGTMAAARAGAGGFGYDPVFVPDEGPAGALAGAGGGDHPRTMAELADAEKDAISHRGGAARALRAWLGA
jgi:XTP/dITP diphosphohydrolase